MDRERAAERLGVPAHEVIKVEDSPAGTIITTFDGVRYVDVSPDNPDDLGRHGLMYLVAPTRNYGGAFPVYSQPGAGDEPEADSALEQLRAHIERMVGDAGLSSALADRLDHIEQRLADIEARQQGGSVQYTPSWPSITTSSNITTSSSPKIDQSPVPTGAVDEVLAWVGDDPARAQDALDAEQAQAAPRKTLVAKLGALAAEKGA